MMIYGIYDETGFELLSFYTLKAALGFARMFGYYVEKYRLNSGYPQFESFIQLP